MPSEHCVRDEKVDSCDDNSAYHNWEAESVGNQNEFLIQFALS